MPRLRPTGPLGLALLAFDIWRRLPPQQRRQLADATRKHGPRLAAQAVNRTRSRRRPPKPE